jgi:hypothetical protein
VTIINVVRYKGRRNSLEEELIIVDGHHRLVIEEEEGGGGEKELFRGGAHQCGWSSQVSRYQ